MSELRQSETDGGGFVSVVTSRDHEARLCILHPTNVTPEFTHRLELTSKLERKLSSIKIK